MTLNHVTLPALVVAESVAFYRRLGFIQIVNSPGYARFGCPDGDATFSAHRVDRVAPGSGAVVCFECDDLDERVRGLEARGVEFAFTPRDERWLLREARLADPTRNEPCLFWAGANRKHLPWRLEAP